MVVEIAGKKYDLVRDTGSNPAICKSCAFADLTISQCDVMTNHFTLRRYGYFPPHFENGRHPFCPVCGGEADGCETREADGATLFYGHCGTVYAADGTVSSKGNACQRYAELKAKYDKLAGLAGAVLNDWRNGDLVPHHDSIIVSTDELETYLENEVKND